VKKYLLDTNMNYLITSISEGLSDLITCKIVYNGNRFLIHVVPKIKKKYTGMPSKIAISIGKTRIFY
jgi:hypothetical protein